LDEIKGIVFCAVIGPIFGISPGSISHAPGDFTIRNKGIGIDDRHRDFELLGSDHVWLEYFILESSELKGDSLQVEFYMVPYSLFIQSCGVHVIHKYEENSKNHPGVIHVDFNFRFYDPNLEFENPECSTEVDELDYDEFSRIERILRSIQSSKRRRGDDDDCNLESSFHPQQNRRSSTLGESQLNPLINA
jgi:hypothetical protein